MSTDRIDNYAGDAHCEYCCDDGQVVLREMRPVFRHFDVHGRPCASAIQAARSERTGFHREEIMAPCPACVRGYRLEWGMGVDPKGNEYTARLGGPWGRDGFWRGRTWQVEIEPTCEHRAALTDAENARLAHEMTERLAAEVAEELGAE